jgi:hypothetical protein
MTALDGGAALAVILPVQVLRLLVPVGRLVRWLQWRLHAIDTNSIRSDDYVKPKHLFSSGHRTGPTHTFEGAIRAGGDGRAS